MKPGVYVHIPFCEQRCYYCAFTIAVSGIDSYEPYINRLIREIEVSGFEETPGTVFLGGGTPSIIDGRLIERVLNSLPKGATEISLEANPGTLSDEKLQHYLAAGINRISLGVQSFDAEDLKNAGRIHTVSDVFRDIDSLRKHGFRNINFDLIAGLPNQRIEIWRENLHWIERLQPEHVSIYMLDVEERSAWGKDPSSLPDDDVFATFYTEAAERLAKAGYIHYEISNWAKPGFECRHNLKYWTGAPYRGFGVSAHSYSPSDRRRFWNTVSLKEFADALDAGKLPFSGSENLTREMRLQEGFLLGLRQICGFDVWVVAEDLGFKYPQEWFDRVCDLEDAGWIRFDGKVLKLTPAGWLLANSLTEELLCPNLLSTSAVTR